MPGALHPPAESLVTPSRHRLDQRGCSGLCCSTPSIATPPCRSTDRSFGLTTTRFFLQAHSFAVEGLCARASPPIVSLRLPTCARSSLTADLQTPSPTARQNVRLVGPQLARIEPLAPLGPLGIALVRPVVSRWRSDRRRQKRRDEPLALSRRGLRRGCAVRPGGVVIVVASRPVCARSMRRSAFSSSPRL